MANPPTSYHRAQPCLPDSTRSTPDLSALPPRPSQALTEGAACTGCRPRPQWSSGAPAPGLPSSSPRWQPCLRHRAGPPDGTQLHTPPSPRCCPHMCCPSRAAAGSSSPGGGPADRCRKKSVIKREQLRNNLYDHRADSTGKGGGCSQTVEAFVDLKIEFAWEYLMLWKMFMMY